MKKQKGRQRSDKKEKRQKHLSKKKNQAKMPHYSNSGYLSNTLFQKPNQFLTTSESILNTLALSVIGNALTNPVLEFVLSIYHHFFLRDLGSKTKGVRLHHATGSFFFYHSQTTLPQGKPLLKSL